MFRLTACRKKLFSHLVIFDAQCSAEPTRGKKLEYIFSAAVLDPLLGSFFPLMVSEEVDSGTVTWDCGAKCWAEVHKRDPRMWNRVVAGCSAVPCWLHHPLTCLPSRQTAKGGLQEVQVWPTPLEADLVVCYFLMLSTYLFEGSETPYSEQKCLKWKDSNQMQKRICGLQKRTVPTVFFCFFCQATVLV